MNYRNAFGAKFSSTSHDIDNSIGFLETSNQNTIVYPVGRHIGVRNIESNEMGFIRHNENVKEITAMCLCPNKRYLAVCERQRNNLSAHICFYDMKTSAYKTEKTTINVCESDPTHQKIIKTIVFSPSSTEIAVIIEGPEYSVVVWDWRRHNTTKAKIKGQVELGKTVATKVSFNPEDTNQVCTTGQNHWKVWRVQEGALRSEPSFQEQTSSIYTDHCWLSKDKIAGCTSEGQIVIFEKVPDPSSKAISNKVSLKFIQKQVIGNAFMSEDVFNISCIKTYSKGFFVASDTGTMALWVKSEENNQSSNQDDQDYDFIRRWSPVVTKGTKVISMDVNRTEDQLAAACQNNNIALVNIKSIGLNDNLTREVKVDLVCRGFHSGPITCMDIAVQRPILVTCSQDDSTIRLWNYYTYKCELTREYFAHKEMMVVEAAKPLLTVAIHPSGYYVAAGFKDKIRIYHVLHDDLRIFRNIEGKHCSKIKFSNGGQWLACIVQKFLYIYRAYTLECVFIEKLSSAQITDLRFSKNDTCCCLVTADGFVQRWIYADNEFQKLNDGAISNKSLDFRSCQFINDKDDMRKVVLAGGDSVKSNIKVLSHKDEILQNFYGDEVKITAGDLLTTPNKISNFIVGTDRGNVKGKV